MVPSILFLGEVVVVVELIEVDHFSRFFDFSLFRDPPDQVRGAPQRAVSECATSAEDGVRE